MVGLNIKVNAMIKKMVAEKNIFILTFMSINIPIININITIKKNEALSPDRKINNALDRINNKLK